MDSAGSRVLLRPGDLGEACGSTVIVPGVAACLRFGRPDDRSLASIPGPIRSGTPAASGSSRPQFPPLALCVVATVSFAVRMTDAVRHARRPEMPTSQFSGPFGHVPRQPHVPAIQL